MARTKSELRPGVFFSPGFYMAYWRDFILKHFNIEDVVSRNEFKQHREMWVGAILAAHQTKETGTQHFVGLPDDEPRDVDVIKMVETRASNGKLGMVIKRLYIQVTTCDFSRGETLLGQALNKNRAAYKGIILAVYAHGRKGKTDFQLVFDGLQKEKIIYPSDIVTVELIGAGSVVMSPGTYAVTRLYPKKGQGFVQIDNPKEFFRYPEIVKGTRRGISTTWEHLGSYELLPPVLKQRASRSNV